MSSKVPRVKNMMYVQQLDKLAPEIKPLIVDHHGDQKWFDEHCGWYDCQPLLQFLLKQPGLEYDHIAVIVHDRDYKYDDDGQIVRDKNGKPVIVAPHVHVARSTSHASYLTVLSRAVKEKTADQVDKFSKGKGRRKATDESNMFAYMYHRTFKAQQLGKFQYDYKDGSANFNIKKMIEDAAVEVQEALKRKSAEKQRKTDKDLLEDYLNKIIDGSVNLADRYADPLLQRIYAKYKTPLENAQLEYKEKIVRLAELHKNAILTNQNGEKDKEIARLKKEIKLLHGNMSKCDIYFITGVSGSGKTVLAEYIGTSYDSKGKPRGVYMATGKDHQFDGYNDQFAIILDELRPDTYRAEMLLTLLDPNQTAKVLDARYKRKLTSNLKCVVITTTLSFAEFVRYIPDKTDTGDAESQYFRRVKEVFDVQTPEPSLKNKGDFIVKYNRYSVKKAEGFGKAYDNGTFLKALETEKNRGKNKFRPLPIYRKNKKGDFQLDHHSDYYLSFVNDGQMTVPFSKLDADTDIEPKKERARLNAMLEEQTQKSINEETKAGIGFDVSDLSEKDRRAAYAVAKEKVNREQNAEPIRVKQQKKETTPDNVAPLYAMDNSDKLPWE